MPSPLLSNNPGGKHLLLGNEAIVRGALEAGVGFVASYPGTPSSEVPDTLFRLSKEGSYCFEYSINEKVALEVGGGAAFAGVSTLVTMKHVGLNVAADPLMTLTYTGTPGGLVLLSADDPGCHSSQNEQDNRYYARLAGLPCLEPASAQEAKDMTRDAFRMSRQFEQPVMLRTTTRVNHLRGAVEFGPLAPTSTKGTFSRDPKRFVPIPAHARIRHSVLLERMQSLLKESETSPWNKQYGKGELGIVVSGISRAYLKDVISGHNLNNGLTVLELGMTYPLPEEKILTFLRQVKKVLILEELEPLVETKVREIAQKNGLSVQIIGKGGPLSTLGEYSTTLIEQALLPFMDLSLPKAETCAQAANLPQRPPNLCAGCPHRATYHAVREVFGDEAIYSSDIGCYTLGILPPLKAADFLLCMGSSISAGSGMAKAQDKPVVAFIGDSTFYHSGITGLINAVFNRHNLLIVILDNRTTAMTGHQPNPGVDQTALGPNPAKVDLEAVVRGCGVTQVRTVKPLNIKSTMAAINEFKTIDGVRVLIAEEPCPLFAKRTLGKKYAQIAYVADTCTNRRDCLNKLACPAFFVEENKVRINPSLCSGCMLCLQLCGHIKAQARSAS